MVKYQSDNGKGNLLSPLHGQDFYLHASANTTGHYVYHFNTICAILAGIKKCLAHEVI